MQNMNCISAISSSANCKKELLIGFLLYMADYTFNVKKCSYENNCTQHCIGFNNHVGF